VIQVLTELLVVWAATAATVVLLVVFRLVMVMVA